MYNFLVTAEDDAWNGKIYEYSLRRFGEHTDNAIKNKYISFSDEAIEELKSFPTLFAYEDPEKIGARIGYITDIRVRHNSIHFKYKIDTHISSIPYSTISNLMFELDINDWELNRTHWAIKDEDLLEVLFKEGLIENRFLFSSLTAQELKERESRAALHKSERLTYLGQMATMMAHNINNPIGIMRMIASGALGDLNENLFNPETELKPLLEKIVQQTERLSVMMANFRKFSKGDRKELTAVNINTLIEDIYQLLFVAPYQIDNIKTLKEFTEIVPIAHANEFALQEMLISLLSNAREAVKEQTNKQIKIETWQQQDKVGFNVEDSGEGISEEQQPQLFTPFLSSKSEGMGLGLYFCREIVKDLGGSIEYYQSNLGGAGFKITLPIEEEKDNGI